MDLAELRAVIDGGETYTVEFKRSSAQHPLNDRELVEAVVCLANGDGGRLLVGVEDDGTVSGATPRHGHTTDSNRLRALIINHTDPAVSTDVQVIPLDGLDVVVIEVPTATTPVGTINGVYKRRSTAVDGTPRCIPYRPHDMLSAGFSLAGRDYAEIPARGATIQDLDPEEFDRYRRMCAGDGADSILATAGDIEICRALRLVRSDGEVTLGAVLLFGREDTIADHVPTAECLYQELNGDRLTRNTTMRMPLLKSAEHLYRLVEQHNSEDEVLVGLFRVPIPRIPQITIREAIANSLVHRDYTELGPIVVQLDDDEFRVSSPGGFPSGVNLTNLLEQSRPRSVILADAFTRAGIVDRAGRGISQMFSSLLRAGRGGPDYSRSTEASVEVAVPTSGSDMDMVRFIATWENDHQHSLPLTQMRILYQIKAVGPSRSAELVNDLALPQAQVRMAANRLVESGLVEARGNGRNRRYHLTAGFYRVAQDRNAYVRTRAVDPMQQDRMVVEYVSAYGHITRSQVAELCMLTSSEARTVLKRLVGDGKLELHGQRRGAYYTLPAIDASD